MKLQLCILIIVGFAEFCTGQSDNSLKLHITKERLRVLEEVQVKNDSTAQGEKEQERFMNFNPVITFKGSKSILTINKDLSDLSQVTIFTVYQSDHGSAAEGLWGIYSEESSITLTTRQIASSEKTLSYEGGSIKTPILNTYIQSYGLRNIHGNPGKHQVILGASSADESDAFIGNIAEIMVFDKMLSGKKRQVIETSLALKYGITLDNIKDYISSDEKGIYSMDENSGYTNRIFGIGRDDGAGLYQKQSHSTEGPSMITIGLGKFTRSNMENNIELPNDNFLILGDNNLDSDFSIRGESETTIPTMARHWKMQVTGDKASEIKTTIQLDISNSFPASKMVESDYLMAIDRSGKGTFLPENTKYIAASSLEENILSFERIQWDTDRSGSDVFSFALKTELEATLTEAEPVNCINGNKGKLFYKVTGGLPPYKYQLMANAFIMDEWKSTDPNYPGQYIDHLSPDIYVLRVTDDEGTQTEVQFDLEAPTPVSVDLGKDRQLLMDSKEILLDATIVSDEKISYEWSSDNGFYSDQPSVKVSLPGRYSIHVISSNGCKASDSIEIERDNIQFFSLFPNPSEDGNYKIRVGLIEKQSIQINVVDMTGRLIYNMSAKGQSSYSIPGIPISSSGIYNVVLQTADREVSRKLVVK